MHVHGGTISGVAKATAPIKEEGKGRPWWEFVNVWNDEHGTHFIGSDGFLVARVSVSQESTIKGVLRRVDAERFKARDSVHIDEIGGGQKRKHVISIEKSGAMVELEPNDGKGDALRVPYDDGPNAVFDHHPEGRPAIRCDAKMLRRALGAFIASGGEQVEVFVAPKAGPNGLIFLSGTNDDGDSIDVALGIPSTGERKSETEGIVEFLIPTPLFDGAGPPPKADPEAAPSDGKTAAAGA